MRLRLSAALLLAVTFLATPAWAGAPVVGPEDTARAARVASMRDSDPVGRLNQLLEAVTLSEAALFVLAASHPGLVQQVVDEKYRPALDYLAALPPAELHKIKRGETLVRTRDDLRGRELKQALAMAESYDFPKFKPEKMRAVSLGALEGRAYKVEVVYQRKKRVALYGSIELAWPSTPERDEETRTDLTRHFGARPSAVVSGAGSLVPVKDGSFETPDAIGTAWFVAQLLELPPGVPRGAVALDRGVALDGVQSLRFNNSERTRWFPAAQQEIPVQPGTRILARCQFRAQQLRPEYLQREDLVGMSLTFVDAGGAPVAAPLRARGRLGTHAWEELEAEATAPPNAAGVLLEVSAPVSGTAWFDGVSLERR